MPMDRFLIAPMNAGLQTNLRPWLIPDEAFAQLNNAYCFRGRIRKRFGSTYMGIATGTIPQVLSSRLSVLLGATDGSGDIGISPTVTVPGMTFSIGQQFSVGSVVFTVYQTGTPANMLRSDGLSDTATYNTSNGDVVITGAPALTDVYFYPGTPVMGLCLYEIGTVNNQPSYAFDTQFAYVFASGYWQRLGTALWHGNNLNFFWTCNWDGITPNDVVLFVTNFNATVPTPAATDDPIWYYDGSNWYQYSGSTNPISGPYTVFLSDGSFVQTARIIINFKNRLLFLNTIEQNASGDNSSYVNRCRFSHEGSPLAVVTSGGDSAPYAWLEPGESYTVGSATGIYDGAGFIDATTQEQIVSAEFIKDRLIVYFERSTWELASTGNNILPFIWQKLNTELGAEAQQCTVPFDKVILTIGNTGVHACNGSNVDRIDTLIPDKIFEISAQTNDTGVQRVCGIRDYFVEMVYWAFPSNAENPNDIYPNRVLVYNYQNGSWAFNDDCITAFGYYEQEESLTWENAVFTWEQANMTWESGSLQAQSRQVIAGNQQGFVFLVEPDVDSNAAVMQLTNAVNGNTSLTLTIINHTLQQGDFIYLTGLQQNITVNGNIVTIVQIASVTDANTVVINPAQISATYTGGGFVARVSQINILSKQWNPYVDKDRNVHIERIDFGVLKTSDGAITVDYYPSYTSLSMINSGTGNSSIMGNGVLEMFPYALYPLENEQTLLWHPVYFQTDGEAVQINMYLNTQQMLTNDIAFSPFELQGLVLYTQPTTARLQ